MTTPKPKGGRPPLPPEEVRSEVIRMRATKAEEDGYDERGGDDWLRRELANKPRFTGSGESDGRRKKEKVTDRELLELAAKAAGYTLGNHSQCGWMRIAGGRERNPLTSDGDALSTCRQLSTWRFVINRVDEFSEVVFGYSVPMSVRDPRNRPVRCDTSRHRPRCRRSWGTRMKTGATFSPAVATATPSLGSGDQVLHCRVRRLEPEHGR